ncbi:hypothetical protein Ancab_032062 [Ancistrocladus abbreviatus]
MGACFSNWIKAESPLHTGVNSKIVSKNKNDLSRSDSRISSASIPASPRRTSSASIPATPRSKEEIWQSTSLQCFCFNELKKATRNFCPDNVVGEGGLGAVFKGWIDEHSLAPARPRTGMAITVKRFNPEWLWGRKEWLTEINYLGQLHHPNIVKLIGYCLEDEHWMLVYEFMPRGSMANHIFKRSSHFQPLSWSLRMKVAFDAAKVLAYLHSDEANVIHGHFKTSNILLDLNYNVKLSDFSLARDVPAGDKSCVSAIVGTMGFMAPEYRVTGQVSTKCDVYSFGAVLLELLSGKRVTEMIRPIFESELVDWEKPELVEWAKPYLNSQFALDHAVKASSLALKCLSDEPKLRPNMDEVVRELEKLQDNTLKEHDGCCVRCCLGMAK